MSQKYTRKVDNKLRGAYGETDLDKKVIRINKKRHKRDTKNKTWSKSIAKKDRTMINTMAHEETHAKHPKMRERTVVKKARASVERMSVAQKNKLRSRYKE